MEDVGEFHRDIAAATDQDGARQLLQVEGFVGRDAKLVAGQRIMRVRTATRGNQDGARRDHAVFRNEPHRMGINEFGAAVEDVRPGILQPAPV